MEMSPTRLPAGATIWMLAGTLLFAVAGCGSDTSTSSPNSEQQAGIGAADAVGSALENVIDEKDENETTLQGGSGFVDQLSGLTRGLPGLGAGVGEMSGDPEAQTAYDYTAVIRDISGTYNCDDGGTIDLTASATWTADWEDGIGGNARYWHEAYTLDDVTFNLNDCSEDGYTVDGVAVFNADNAVDFDETGVSTDIYDVLLVADEDSEAVVAVLDESSGRTYDFDMSWTFDATLEAIIDAASGETELTGVNVTATYNVNDWSCTGTWTDPDGPASVTCSNNQ